VRNLYRYLALSDARPARLARKLYWRIVTFTLPTPRVIVKPMLWAFLAVRTVYYWLIRVFVCEPLFKAYCTRYGRGVRTGAHIHWVQGVGNIILGDNVLIDGKCSFLFAARFSDAPTLTVGDNTSISAGSAFTIGKRIEIGRNCRIASQVWILDSSGHTADPEARLAGLPPSPEDVRPVTIGENVWIGAYSIIFPGVSIGDGSVVSAASVVTSDVPPYTVVAGNPARRVGTLARPISRNSSADESGPARVSSKASVID
jgi:acetyltransferase-like isoleucine patch superfamily enzyme